MDIEEINDTSSFSMPDFSLPDNLKTSDELDTHSTDYLEYGKTNYARNKKVKSSIKGVGILLSFSVTGVLSGSLILSSSLLNNSYIGTLPSLKRNPTFLLIDNSIYSSFDLENNGNLNAYLNLSQNNNILDKKDITQTSSYNLKYDLPYFSKEYTLSFLLTNNNDYKDENKLFNKFNFISNSEEINSFSIKDNNLSYSIYLKNYNDYDVKVSLEDNNQLITKITLNDNLNTGQIKLDNYDSLTIKINLEKDEDIINLYEYEYKK